MLDSQYPQLLLLPIGLPGAGKTTACKRLSEALGAVHLWVDEERYNRYGAMTTSAQSTELYAELNQTTDSLLAAGQSVIYDTAFNYCHDRDHLRGVASRHGAITIVLWVQTPQHVARRRAVEVIDPANRVLGAMTSERFDQLAMALEEPRAHEDQMIIDGLQLHAIQTAELLEMIGAVLERRSK